MEMNEVFKKVGGVEGLRRLVVKRNPNPDNASDELPRVRENFFGKVPFTGSITRTLF